MKTTLRLTLLVLVIIFVFAVVQSSKASTSAAIHTVSVYGVVFKFDSITVSPELVIPKNTNNIVDSKTTTALKVSGTFTGNYETLVDSGHEGSSGLFYMTDGAGNVYGWNIIEPDKTAGTIKVTFDIPTGATYPYVMHTNADKNWSFDLILK